MNCSPHQSKFLKANEEIVTAWDDIMGEYSERRSNRDFLKLDQEI